MNELQRAALKLLCERYGVEFDEAHYHVWESTSWMAPGWAEGWIGGPEHNGLRGKKRTLYVGCSPEGHTHS